MMVLDFIETPKKRKPNPAEPEKSPTRLFLFGLLFILGFISSMVPFGAYTPVSVSVWAILILFLPMFFLGISMTGRYGYTILFAVFLSLLGGVISILFLGDYIGYITKLTAVSDLNPERAVLESNFKYIFLKDFKLLPDEGCSFRAHITVRARGNLKYYGPVLQFRLAPIRSLTMPDKKIPLYALCYAEVGETCDFSDSAKGGNVLRESIWDLEKTNVKGEIPSPRAIFLIWKPFGEEEIQRKGLSSLFMALGLICIWAVVCYRERGFSFFRSHF